MRSSLSLNSDQQMGDIVSFILPTIILKQILDWVSLHPKICFV